jgi:hypothetical protein
MNMTLVASGITSEKIKIAVAFSVPYINPFASFKSDRLRTIISADFCFVEINKVFIRSGR